MLQLIKDDPNKAFVLFYGIYYILNMIIPKNKSHSKIVKDECLDGASDEDEKKA